MDTYTLLMKRAPVLTFNNLKHRTASTGMSLTAQPFSVSNKFKRKLHRLEKF